MLLCNGKGRLLGEAWLLQAGMAEDCLDRVSSFMMMTDEGARQLMRHGYAGYACS